MKTLKRFFTLLCFVVVLCSCNEQENTVSKDGNAVIENIMSRRSIRKYLAKPIDREVLNAE
mgnify:FL=1